VAFFSGLPDACFAVALPLAFAILVFTILTRLFSRRKTKY
jgi:TRAP-type C4-dicarboxylate transport system permease small subunit